MKYTFKNELIECIIVKRKSQFTMIVNIDGEEVSCHCPTTGRIGDLDTKNIACLLSKSEDPKRKTPYTVEAVSAPVQEAKKKGLEAYEISMKFAKDGINIGKCSLKEQIKCAEEIQHELERTY